MLLCSNYATPPPTGVQSYCAFVLVEGRAGGGGSDRDREGRGAEVFLRSKRRRHLPKIRTFKKSDNLFLADRHTLWFIGKLHFQISFDQKGRGVKI